MKKFVTAVAVVALVAFAAPVFAATNPFMDVPMNHWAYDAIGQLAAHGILSGYPDGTYKGKQPTTRYEMASALARALAVVDMTKASKQDVEMLQKLVVEFHDELEALGVRVDDIEGKVNLLDSRLGGWKLSGQLRLDIQNESINEPQESDGSVTNSRYRINLERWFGDPENPMHFFGRFGGQDATWERFYVEIPFFYDTLLTVGRSNGDYGADYYIGGTTSLPNTGGFAGTDSVLTDREIDKFQIDKQFGMGNVTAYVAHPSLDNVKYQYKDDTNTLQTVARGDFSAWELFLMGKFQFNEQFGFDLGFQGFFGDNAEDTFTAAQIANGDNLKSQENMFKFNDLWTVFAGLRFNFNDNVAFKGIFYHQKNDIDYWLTDKNGNNAQWREWDANQAGYEKLPDDANHWRLIVDVKQEALKFTSLWLEYGQYDAGFISPLGKASFASSSYLRDYFGSVAKWDMKYYRIALGQTWNDKWATHLFYYGYDPDYAAGSENDKASEWGLGVQYTYNPNVKFGLNFVQADTGVKDSDKDNVVRFRTEVTF